MPAANRQEAIKQPDSPKPPITEAQKREIVAAIKRVYKEMGKQTIDTRMRQIGKHLDKFNNNVRIYLGNINDQDKALALRNSNNFVVKVAEQLTYVIARQKDKDVEDIANDLDVIKKIGNELMKNYVATKPSSVAGRENIESISGVSEESMDYANLSIEDLNKMYDKAETEKIITMLGEDMAGRKNSERIISSQEVLMEKLNVAIAMVRQGDGADYLREDIFKIRSLMDPNYGGKTIQSTIENNNSAMVVSNIATEISMLKNSALFGDLEMQKQWISLDNQLSRMRNNDNYKEYSEEIARISDELREVYSELY